MNEKKLNFDGEKLFELMKLIQKVSVDKIINCIITDETVTFNLTNNMTTEYGYLRQYELINEYPTNPYDVPVEQREKIFSKNELAGIFGYVFDDE